MVTRALLARVALALLLLATACGHDARQAHLIPPAHLVASGAHRSDVAAPLAPDDRDRTPHRTVLVVATTAVRASRGARRAPTTKPPVPLGVRPDAATNVGATARVSWYARGCCTASGERFQPDGLTFAARSHQWGRRIRFCNGGRCVVARQNDYGPAAYTGRDFDLSRGAFRAIAPLGAGVVDVTWEVVG